MLIESVVLGRARSLEPEWMGLQRAHLDPVRHLLAYQLTSASV